MERVRGRGGGRCLRLMVAVGGAGVAWVERGGGGGWG